MAQKLKFLAEKWQRETGSSSVTLHDEGFGRWSIVLQGNFNLEQELALVIPKEYIRLTNKVDKKKK